MGSIAIPNTFIFGAIVTLGFAIQFQDKYCFQALLIVQDKKQALISNMECLQRVKIVYSVFQGETIVDQIVSITPVDNYVAKREMQVNSLTSFCNYFSVLQPKVSIHLVQFMQEVRVVDNALCVPPAENDSPTVEVRNNIAHSSNSAKPFLQDLVQHWPTCNVKWKRMIEIKQTLGITI